jgi:hypothetical protein
MFYKSNKSDSPNDGAGRFAPVGPWPEDPRRGYLVGVDFLTAPDGSLIKFDEIVDGAKKWDASEKETLRVLTLLAYIQHAILLRYNDPSLVDDGALVEVTPAVLFERYREFLGEYFRIPGLAYSRRGLVTHFILFA